MNKTRCRALIKALRSEAGGRMFYLGNWVSRKTALRGTGFVPVSKPPRQAFKSGGHCGTTACIAGMAAVIDPAWEIPDDEMPPLRYKGRVGSGAFALWLGITKDQSHRLCYPNSGLWHRYELTTAAEAAEVLERFMVTGRLMRSRVKEAPLP